MRRRRALRRGLTAMALAALAVTLPPGEPAGQAVPASQAGPASLIADQVSYDRESRVLTATGNVEVLYQGRVLHAARITYDEAANQIRAEGPLVLTDPAGGGVLLADAATLTPDLEQGLISSARLLIAGKMQLAATEVRRNGTRYATLYNTIASSCTICAGNSTPTWALRASRVTRDAAEQRIYFQNARLELFGVPVGYLPRASIPEPGVARATGVLVPQFVQSDIYGFGIKVPYYKTLGASADMTVTPFVTTGGSKLVEGQYRRRYNDGGFDLSGVLAVDDGLDGVTNGVRGTLAAIGGFALGNDFKAYFDLALVSDKSFLAQFDYSDADRLTSTAGIQRVRADEFINLDTVAFQSLRDDENDATIPFVLPEFSYRRLIETPGIGGRLGIDAQSLGIARSEGRDMFRAGGSVDWRNDWVLRQGVLASSTFAANFDAYQVWDDPGEDGFHTRAVPTASLMLSWPLVRATASAQHVIEPVIQVIYSGTIGDADVPNEDSQLPEFDDTNLYSLNRFPGPGPARDRVSRQRRDQLHPPGPLRLVARADRRPGASRQARRPVLRRHRPFGAAFGLRGLGVARPRLGADRGQPRALRSQLRLPAQRVRARLRRRQGRGARGLRLPAAGRFRPRHRPAARDQRARTRCPLPGAAELGGARALALRCGDQQQFAGRRWSYLRQRVRGVRPFGLAPLHLIG